MSYAIIQTGGKQYKVSEGDTITVESIAERPNETVQFDNVLLCVMEDGKVLVGLPTVKHTAVIGKVVNHIHGQKIRVAVFHAKVRHRKVRGHRQRLTAVRIEKIVTTASNPAPSGAGSNTAAAKDAVRKPVRAKSKQKKAMVAK
ncbi:MAG: 50S ribosomal protein L21 [Candidatus Levybacteria bacterium]|nr:50S ribosomal protein L21 [Candidatus Levybacteria bacterium]